LSFRELGYSLAQKAVGRGFTAQVQEIRDSTRDKGVLADAEERYVDELLAHAYANVPYYRELFKSSGLVKDGGVDASRFGGLPLLTKKTVRDNYSQLASADSRARRSYEDRTGGSTGEPLRILKDNVCDSWVIATVRYYFKEMLGLDYLKSRKFLLGAPFREPTKGFRGWATLWLSNTVYANCLRLSETLMDSYVRALNSHNPDVVICYPTALYEILRFVERKGLKVPKPKAVVSSSEVLHDFIREKAEEAFGTKVYDFYGANEANAIAGECHHGSMHVFTFNNRVEAVEASDLGSAGKVVVTPLHNFTMPLLRYENGDVALQGGGTCGCGSPLPTLGRIVGRTMDYFTREDGVLVHPYIVFPFFRGNGSVRAFQIIQEDYKRVRVVVVMEGRDMVWQDHAEDGIRNLMGGDCRVVWEFVEEIPKTSLGKYLYIKSFVHRD
jgi:phenylacetate-CoA ligase